MNIIISTVYAQTGKNADGSDLGCADADYVPLNRMATLIADGAKILLPAGILVFFVMLLVGGFKYITSGGDMKTLDSAKGTMTFAFIGVGFLVSAWLILNLVGNSILLGGGNDGFNIFNFQLDEIITTLSGDNSASNPCFTGSTVN